MWFFALNMIGSNVKSTQNYVKLMLETTTRNKCHEKYLGISVDSSPIT